MTTSNNEGQEVVTLEPAESRITFARKNDLQKVLRRSDKSLEAAFKLLEDVIEDKDAEPKLKVDAAKFLIEKRIAISSEIARDQLSRVVGEAKLVMARQATQQKRIKDVGGEDESEDDTPRYIPNMILDHSEIKSM